MPPGRRARRRRAERGFTYLGLLVLVVLLGLALAAVGEVSATAARRAKEAQLLWAGHEYRAAIGRFWRQRHAFPQSLQDLLGSGPDDPIHVHYLRRLYRDPMTNAVDWVLVPAPGGGGFVGVASRSTRAPLKTGGFDDLDREFEDATTYAGWQFVFLPGGHRRPVPGAPGAPPAPGP